MAQLCMWTLLPPETRPFVILLGKCQLQADTQDSWASSPAHLAYGASTWQGMGKDGKAVLNQTTDYA